MSQPLRSYGKARTTDGQRLRRADKRFDSFGDRIPTAQELQERIVALEAQIADNAQQIQAITAALKEAGPT